MSSQEEKENTYRALADQDLLVTSPFCRFGFHKWTKWKKIREFIIKSYLSDQDKKYYELELQKQCIHCNLVKSKVLTLRRAGIK